MNKDKKLNEIEAENIYDEGYNDYPEWWNSVANSVEELADYLMDEFTAEFSHHYTKTEWNMIEPLLYEHIYDGLT
ncbi:MAG TPA: hypothetical protein ENG87_05955 [Candidatus Pacearchaeota archaeon]|nr:hypothetical protein [Candidatus Pacearchaeota archaeon]